jgi:hypothetical protein
MQTQTIRGVAITSDSVKNADSAFSPVEDTVDTNYLNELVESANGAFPPVEDIVAANYLHELVESANGAFPLVEAVQDILDTNSVVGFEDQLVDATYYN